MKSLMAGMIGLFSLATMADMEGLASTDYARPYESSSLFSQPTAEVIDAGEINFGGTSTINNSKGKGFNGDFTFGLGGVAEISTSIKNMANNIEQGQQSMPVATLKIQVFPGTKSLPLQGAVMLNKSYNSSQAVSYFNPDSNALEERVYDVEQVDAYLLSSYQYKRLTFNLGGKFVGTRVSERENLEDKSTAEDIRFYPLGGFKYNVNKSTQIIGEVQGSPYVAYDEDLGKGIKIKDQIMGQFGVRYFILTWISIDAGTGMNFVLGDKRSKDNFLSNAELRTRLSMMIPTRKVFKRIVNQLK